MCNSVVRLGRFPYLSASASFIVTPQDALSISLSTVIYFNFSPFNAPLYHVFSYFLVLCFPKLFISLSDACIKVPAHSGVHMKTLKDKTSILFTEFQCGVVHLRNHALCEIVPSRTYYLKHALSCKSQSKTNDPSMCCVLCSIFLLTEET